jgi:hypothetical protein
VALLQPATWPAKPDAARRLVALAELGARHLVLAAGSASVELAFAAKRAVPTTSVIALVPDQSAATRGRSRANQLGVVIRFDRGTSADLLYGKDTFDRILVLARAGDAALVARRRGLLSVLRGDGQLHLLLAAAEAPGWNGPPAHYVFRRD